MEKLVSEDHLLVRDVKVRDLADLTRLKSPTALHRDRLGFSELSTFRYLVLERNDRLIGFACLVFVRPVSWSDGQDTTHLPQIVDLMISPGLRGKGYGSYLIRSMERYAYRRGAAELYLSVDPVNNLRALALYIRLGYRQIQKTPYMDHWEFVDSGGNFHMGDDWRVDLVKLLDDLN